MKIFTSQSGGKKVTITKGQDGYGDKIFNCALVQISSSGIGLEEDCVDIKQFTSEKMAINWANKQLK